MRVVRSEAEPKRLTAMLLPFQFFGFGNVFPRDENMFQAIDVDGDDFGFHRAGNRQGHHLGHAGVRNHDVASKHRLGENAAAVEVDRFDVETVLLPDSFFLHDPPQIGADAGAAVAEH